MKAADGKEYTTIGWLGRYKYIDLRIEAKAEQAMHMRTRLEGPRAVLSSTPRGNAGMDWTKTLIKLIDLENEIDQELGALIASRKEITAAINSVPDERLQTILELRYVNGKSWQTIADEMHYTREHVLELHRRSLKYVAGKKEVD